MFERITFDPPIGAPLVVGLAALLFFLAALVYWRAARGIGQGRRALLALFRLLALAGLAIVLLRPMVLRPEQAPTVYPIFSVIVDTSASMNTKDVEGASRYKAVADALKRTGPALERELGKRYRVKFFEFADKIQPATLESLTSREKVAGDGTDVGAALLGAANASAGYQQSGILVISDGRANAGAGPSGARDAARYLRSQRIPAWTIPLGTATDAKDIFITARLGQNFLFARQPGSVKVTLNQTGYDNWYAKVNLLREGKYVTSQQVMLRGSGAQLEFPIREEGRGLYQYTVEAEPLPGEADTGNNRRSIFARVVDSRTQVLVVEARPYWDSKFLLRSLRRDPNLDVTSIYHMNPRKVLAIKDKPAEGAGAKTSAESPVRMPKTKEELYKYDCVILGRDIDTIFTSEELRLLKDYLTERGGSIVFARGRAYDGESPEIAGIEPVVWGEELMKEIRLQLTPEGKASSIFSFSAPKSPDVVLRELPSMISITKVVKEKSLSVILAKGGAEGPDAEVAAISYQRYGKGKVMSIGATGLWRWAFTPSGLAEYDAVYNEFWSQVVRWLVAYTDFLPGQDISFETDKESYVPSDQVRLTIRTKFVNAADFRPRIEVKRPDGSKAALAPSPDSDQPGVYTTFYKPEAEGEFQATLYNNLGEPKEDVARFTVYSDAVETRFTAADDGLMEALAETTGGQKLALADLEKLPAKVREFERAASEKLKPKDVWDRLPIFLLLVGLLSVEWFVRRRTGLV